jgi:peptidyl-prolyl cis-trans isomerase A (cyclophilin A)
VPGFVVQGGSISAIDGKPKTTHNPIVLEPPSVTGLTNAVGTIAMARTAELNSATSQFFFNTVDNNTSTGNNLDLPAGEGYAVFGVVTTGLDVVKLIEATPIPDPTLVSSYVVVTSMVQNQ